MEERINLRNSAIKDLEAGVIVPLVDASYYAYDLRNQFLRPIEDCEYLKPNQK